MNNKMDTVLTQKKKVLLTLFLIVVIAILPLLEVTVVPEWQIQFVDENENAVQNARVIQVWKDYSIQWFLNMEGTDTIMTDSNGFIVFPERNIRVSLLGLLIGWLWEVSPSINPHTSYGKHSYVICQDKISCTAFYSEGKDLPNHVIVKKMMLYSLIGKQKQS
jgi:hypothetical protein